jgi:hypothetical protein
MSVSLGRSLHVRRLGGIHQISLRSVCGGRLACEILRNRLRYGLAGTLQSRGCYG